MKRINHVLGPWKNIKKVDPEQWKEWMKDPAVAAFRQENPDLTEVTFRRSAAPLHQFIQERNNCRRCPGLDRCPNLVQGYRPELERHGDYIDMRMGPCDKRLAQEEQNRQRQLIRSHYIPADILNATFETMTLDQERSKPIEAAIQFCEQFTEGRPKKGLYFYGAFGVGKSRIAAAIAQELVLYGVDSLMIYVPEFMREIKESIRDGMIQTKLDTIKKATVLILDDIGAETLTPWTRDEILGAILQYRMAEGLPMVFTSNYDLKELEDHLAHSDKGGVERTKAKRIMERIRYYVDVYLVKGPNRRQQP